MEIWAIFSVRLTWSQPEQLKDKEELEQLLGKEFNINVVQKEIRDLGEENLKDLLDKLHALPDDELQETLRTYPTIREIWYKHC